MFDLRYLLTTCRFTNVWRICTHWHPYWPI